MRIFFALLSAVIGLLLVFSGYRLGRLLIPLMGFMVGLSLGGAVIGDLAGEVFLGTLLGVVVGLTSGLLLALLAYFYYYIAVIIMTGGLGYWLGSGFILLLGFSPGALSVLVGIGIGILVGLAAIATDMPKYVLMVLTTFAGAVMTVGGIMLLFNQIPFDTYSYTTARVALSNSFWWSAVGVVLFVAGLVAQIRTTGEEYYLGEWSMASDDHTHRMPPTTTTHAHGY